ncbi:uncharacterized protein LOC143569947 [Bidens hawaiensis]|uniref:uncharacterized protein LOC143569947 n=1 Tax=Bidens hawaiensis TaxID=980011 RepID=UPI00404AB3FA
MHLEGDALDLYSWLSAEAEMAYWEDLVREMQRHFGPPEFQNPDEYLCSIKQTGSVQEYRQEFARRSARVSNRPDHCLLGVFLNGLKEELKVDVRIHKPRIVYKAVSLALEFESKLNLSCPDKKITWSSQLKSDSKPVTPSTYSSGSNIPSKSDSKSNYRLTDPERQARLLKGECFKCGDKYSHGYRCKVGTFKVLEAGERIGEEPVTETTETDMFDEVQEETAEISLHAILGKPHPTTMKIHGMIGSTEILILIDGGSTHNFILDMLVNELTLTNQPVAPFGVQIGNGDVIRCGHICKNLALQVNDLKIVQDFYPFSLGGADLVLGIQWLATLNTVQANWKEMFTIFTIDGKKHKLQVYSSNMEQHLTHLEQALELLQTHQFFAKKSKCCFGQSRVVFLGHVITSKGVQVEPEKIQAVQSWPTPNYGLIARPLNALTKKDGFLWSDEATKAFDKLKQALTTTPILRFPDFTKAFTVECDASSEGVGAILSQDDHPVAYFSKGFSPQIDLSQHMTMNCWLWCWQCKNGVITYWVAIFLFAPTTTP